MTVPNCCSVFHLGSHECPVAAVLDVFWAGWQVPMQKGSGVVGFLAYVVNVGIPGQGVGEDEAQVFCLFCPIVDWVVGVLELTLEDRSLMNARNRSGPYIVPCGTPEVTGAELEDLPYITTFCVLLDRKKGKPKSPGRAPARSRSQPLTPGGREKVTQNNVCIAN